MTLDDADVHQPFCKYCYECQFCIGIDNDPDKDECEESPDGQHEFKWYGE